MNLGELKKIEDFWDSQPCNVKHSLLEVGTKEYFIEVSKKRYFVEPHIMKFLNAEKYERQTVLELGCGIGTDAAYLASKSIKYQGIDISKASVDIAILRFDLFKLSGKFAHCPIEKFDLVSTGFQQPDLVYSFGVLHHTVDPVYALSKIVRQVKVGCEFKIMLYAKYSYKMAMIKAGLDQFEAQSNVPYASTYSRDEAESLMRQVGLSVQKISQDHLFMFNLEKYKNNIFEIAPEFESMSPEIRNAMRQYLGWHLLIDAIKI